jgi:hypothetical protein
VNRSGLHALPGADCYGRFRSKLPFAACLHFRATALGAHAHDFRLTLYRLLKALNRSAYFLGAHNSAVFRAISGQHVFCDFFRAVC